MAGILLKDKGVNIMWLLDVKDTFKEIEMLLTFIWTLQSNISAGIKSRFVI